MSGKFRKFLAAGITLVALLATAGTASALTQLTVMHNPPSDNVHFATIQAAIDYASAQLQLPNPDTYSILVQADPDPYVGNFTPISNVPIVGARTAGTFISGAGTGPVVTISAGNVTVRNFTFLPSPPATTISISNVVNTTITNNVFLLSTDKTAIQNNSTGSRILNNTFYGNGTAVNTSTDLVLDNNIFSNNKVAIVTSATLTGATYNLYNPLVNAGITVTDPQSIPNNRITASDPLFLSPALQSSGDFHLQTGSPAIGNGDPAQENSFERGSGKSDMGAYGGPNSDPVTRAVTVTAEVLSATSIRVSWTPNTSSQVSYKLFYGRSATSLDGTDADEGTSPISIPSGTTSKDLTGLEFTPPAAPDAPAITLSSGNQSIKVTWNPVDRATRYTVYYSETTFGDADISANRNDIRHADTTSTTYTIGGLTNTVHYFIAVRAAAQAQYFFAVQSVIGGTDGPLSTVVSAGIGQEIPGALSTVGTEFPESISPYPNLKGEGCFIATAAYGVYSAPQVQALRDFRDRYLMTNAPGRAFVAWYYKYGPIGAHYLNLHPALKPLVRALLFPLVVGSLFLTGTSTAMKLTLVLMATATLILLRKRRLALARNCPPNKGRRLYPPLRRGAGGI